MSPKSRSFGTSRTCPHTAPPTSSGRRSGPSAARQDAARTRCARRRRIEVTHRRRRGERQAGDHPCKLHRLAHLREFEICAVRRYARALGGLSGRACKRAHSHPMAAGREVANHVERPDLAPALGRERESVAHDTGCSCDAEAFGTTLPALLPIGEPPSPSREGTVSGRFHHGATLRRRYRDVAV